MPIKRTLRTFVSKGFLLEHYKQLRSYNNLLIPTKHRSCPFDSSLYFILNAIFVYILTSEKDQSFYIGQTQNLQSRIDRHNKGYNTATKSKRPWKLMHAFEVESRAKAMKLERKLKSMRKRSSILAFIERDKQNKNKL